MNHDYTHCADYEESCPKKCFRARLTEDLKKRKEDLKYLPISWANFKGTDWCKR